MTADATPLLFSPPAPPVRLDRTRPAVIGRGSACDLRVHSHEASRHHAEVRFNGKAFAIRDLGSTNGTAVNGTRVEGERELTPGDQIGIAGFTITFCQFQADLQALGAASDEAQTKLFAGRSPAHALRGDLSEIPAFAVLQVLELGHKTGVLESTEHNPEGRIWLANGAPVHAETKGQLGFDAASDLVHAKCGRFAFEPGVAAPQNTIAATVTELLLEAMRQMDETTK